MKGFMLEPERYRMNKTQSPKTSQETGEERHTIAVNSVVSEHNFVLNKM